MTTQTKEEALELLEATREDWLASARAWAKNFARNGAPITIEDVRRHGPAIPEHVDPRVAGAVFNEKGVWEALGYVAGTRATSHKRPVMRYKLVGA